MSEIKTTQGPWEFMAPEAERGYILARDGGHAIRIAETCGSHTNPEVSADGRLLASAPTMLSALKAADASMTLAWTDPSHADARRELGTEMCEIWIQIRSAISQADGQ